MLANTKLAICWLVFHSNAKLTAIMLMVTSTTASFYTSTFSHSTENGTQTSCRSLKSKPQDNWSSTPQVMNVITLKTSCVNLMVLAASALLIWGLQQRYFIEKIPHCRPSTMDQNGSHFRVHEWAWSPRTLVM